MNQLFSYFFISLILILVALYLANEIFEKER